ncbi:MAG: cytochrome c [Steroidobacteraceae bacterium]|uniref:cytochrome c n=1 Tax=Hydrogenophaga sp. TaxID=1904254 RepID=UPI001D5130F0|nr:cytochrome c [Hydrogenophaga sp.]MBX3694305.1 cytochrome c [Steroidobacteraceae bacterium]MCW5572328.1 cytochrome c [Steroidobacteraceae bacterium]MCW5672741.1 cytochrome c [Hydrogenophaga sp.]
MIHPKPRPAHTAALTVVLLASVATFCAQAAEPSAPMALRNIMAQLGRDIQAVAGGISTEDWTLVARLAPDIARHPEPPPSEKMRILGWLGTDAGRFRGFDGEVHDAAVAMGEAATRGDGQAVITAFAKVQQGCLACHQSFRKPFTEHFYGVR